MKKAIQVTEVAGEGLESFLGTRITVFCANYTYTGDLDGVNSTCIKLVNAKMVFETGPFNEPKWKNAEDLPHPVYIQTQNIESFMELK